MRTSKWMVMLIVPIIRIFGLSLNNIEIIKEFLRESQTRELFEHIHGVNVRNLCCFQVSAPSFFPLSREEDSVIYKKTRKAKGMGILAFLLFCRGDRIRTCDHLVPNQVRYRTALRPAGK